MRPTQDHTFHTRSGGTAQSTVMSFDENSLEFLMDVMTNLYSDTVGAPIREYPSNALDSHRDAGVDRPIEVRLPTRFNARFEVQDFGLGMSPDDITNIYSKYGYSTKRDSDEVVGMLGLGSKSGLTYTNQFSVTAIKNGVKTLATVARGQDGAGTINILDTSATDEANGVTISIPVHDVAEFRMKAERFFRFWEPGTVLIDGKPPEYPDDGDTLKVADDIIIHKRHTLSEDVVVMGSIPYTCGAALSQDLPWGFRVVAYVPMGSVNFPPNREQLQYTARTNATLADINKRRAAGIAKAAEHDIREAKTAADAIRAARTWKGLLGGTPVQYRNMDIPHRIKAADGHRFYFYNGNRYRHRLETLASIEAESFVDTVVVHNFTNTQLSSHNRRKISAYFDTHDIDSVTYIVTDAKIGGPWSEGVTHVDWDDVKTIRLSNGGGSRKATAPDKFHTYDGSHNYVDTVEADDIVLVSPTVINERNRNSVHISTIHDALPNATLVLLAKNRWEKFAREHDNVRTLDAALRARAKEFEQELTDYQYLDIQGRSYTFDVFNKLDPTKVEDPDVVDLIEQMRGVSRRNEWYAITRSFMVAKDNMFDRLELADRDLPFEHVLDTYPFIEYARRNTDHSHYYINLVYRDRKESN